MSWQVWKKGSNFEETKIKRSRIESEDCLPLPAFFFNETLSASIEESDCSFDITDVEFQSHDQIWRVDWWVLVSI